MHMNAVVSGPGMGEMVWAQWHCVRSRHSILGGWLEEREPPALELCLHGRHGGALAQEALAAVGLLLLGVCVVGF